MNIFNHLEFIPPGKKFQIFIDMFQSYVARKQLRNAQCYKILETYQTFISDISSILDIVEIMFATAQQMTRRFVVLTVQQILNSDVIKHHREFRIIGKNGQLLFGWYLQVNIGIFSRQVRWTGLVGTHTCLIQF